MRNSGDLPAADGWRLDGRHVLFGMIGFFLVIFGVNGVFLYSALSTHTGIVASEPYRKGLAYNERIAADEQQTERGWSQDMTIVPDGRLALHLTDKNKDPIGTLAITARVGRPATANFDRQMKLTETTPGNYAADLGKLAEGSWIVAIEARDGDDKPIYRSRRRVWLKP